MLKRFALKLYRVIKRIFIEFNEMSSVLKCVHRRACVAIIYILMLNSLGTLMLNTKRCFQRLSYLVSRYY